MIPFLSFSSRAECSRINRQGKGGGFDAPGPAPYIAKMTADAPLFDAELTPHRSLSPRGFLLLMLGIGTISFAGGLAFFLAGAWPVVGFLGADVLLIYLAFRINYRRARLVERLHLTRDRLTVSRTWPGGRSASWEFQPSWLQVICDAPRDTPRGPESPLESTGDCPLILRSHGRSLAVGSFLTRQERRDLADALRAALHRAAQPCRPCSPCRPDRAPQPLRPSTSRME
jgi:uncharacterized membrane protein